MALAGVQLHLVDCVDEAQALMSWLGERPAQLGAVAVDTESSGLSPEQDFLRLVQISDDQTGWAIPWERWGGVAAEALQRWQSGRGNRIRMHHAPHDVSFLAKVDVAIDRSRVDDTRLAGHVLEPMESTALKNQASRHVDPRAASLQRQLDEFMAAWTWGTVPIVPDGPAAIYWQYGALDSILTFQLADVHLPAVQREAPRAYQLELGTAWITSDMARRGTRCDREYAQTQLDRLLKFIDQAAQWCQDEYQVSPATSSRIIDVVRRDTNFEFAQKTKGGALSLDRNVLAAIVRDTAHPLATAVLQRRQAQKVGGSFLQQFMQLSEFDGLLHPRINSIGGRDKTVEASEGTYGVKTARMSMDHPNLQGLPRLNEANPFAAIPRNCIVPRDVGRILLFCDLDQIEMRIFAWLAQDPGLIGAFAAADSDFFTALARSIYQDDALMRADPRRQTTKSAAYAKAYFAGIDKFAATAGIAPDSARAFMARFDGLYPGVKALQRKLELVCRERIRAEGVAYVRSPFTNRRHTAQGDAWYQLLNRLIQGVCAELFKLKLLELDAAGLGEYMVLPVHDEIILDLPDGLERDAVQTIHDIMNDNTILGGVPVTAGISRGLRWGEKQEVRI